MKKATDFRRLAREALRGRWIMAVFVGLVAMILGGAGSSGSGVKLDYDMLNGVDVNFTFANQTIASTAEGINPRIASILIGGAIVTIIVALIIGVLYFILGSFVGVGYARYNLELVDHKEAGFETLFSSFSNWKTTAAAKFLQGLYILLWSLLLVVPGIMAAYSYAMTEFILAENPNLSAKEAINQSKEMMKGNRWRLFCLDISFIGWMILCGFTFGIGNFWLNAYTNSARAAFYREVSGTESYVNDYTEEAAYCEAGEGYHE